MTSSANSKDGDDQISVVTGHPVLQNYHPLPNGNHNGSPKPESYFKNCVLTGAYICIMLFIVTMIAQMMMMPPTPLPNFSVSSFTVSFINATSSYQIALNFTIRKPDSHATKTIAYDNIVASLYYDSYFIGTSTLFPFKQEEERNSVAVVKAKFMVDPKIDVGVVGVFDVRVTADASVNDPTWWRKLDVFCEDIRVESGSMAGPMKDCRVEGSFDI